MAALALRTMLEGDPVGRHRPSGVVILHADRRTVLGAASYVAKTKEIHVQFVGSVYELRGIGKTLLDLMLKQACRQVPELTRVVLPCASATAEQFYAKLGFERKAVQPSGCVSMERDRPCAS